MKESQPSHLEGQVIDEDVEFSLAEFCRVSGASGDQLMLWIEEGVIEPQGAEPHQWRFSGALLKRVRMARRLATDLGINAPGIALALDLLDEINVLQVRLRSQRL